MFSKITLKMFGFALLLFVLESAGATAAKAANTPEQTAKNFYKWYLAELNREGGNLVEKKTTVLKSVSKRLGKWIYSTAYGEYGADYFIDAQNYDENWQVTTTRAVIKGNKAPLKVLFAAPGGKPSKFKQTLVIKMVKEGNTWKIDSVNNRELSA
ncbi:hypothetical protein BH24ACI1_BH24ACI1_24350 [soil metagenome]|jgi:hypothetical protein|nr:DUF3828 domain-containing protein [Pyrinomonadaceae bacterium]